MCPKIRGQYHKFLSVIRARIGRYASENAAAKKFSISDLQIITVIKSNVQLRNFCHSKITGYNYGTTSCIYIIICCLPGHTLVIQFGRGWNRVIRVQLFLLWHTNFVPPIQWCQWQDCSCCKACMYVPHPPPHPPPPLPPLS